MEWDPWKELYPRGIPVVESTKIRGIPLHMGERKPGEVVHKTPSRIGTPRQVRVSGEIPPKSTPMVTTRAHQIVNEIIQKEVEAIEQRRCCREPEENQAQELREQEIRKREIEHDERMAKIRLEIVNAKLQNQKIQKPLWHP